MLHLNSFLNYTTYSVNDSRSDLQFPVDKQ